MTLNLRELVVSEAAWPCSISENDNEFNFIATYLFKSFLYALDVSLVSCRTAISHEITHHRLLATNCHVLQNAIAQNKVKSLSSKHNSDLSKI